MGLHKNHIRSFAMLHRWCLIMLGTTLLAAPPQSFSHQTWALALDARGGLVGDLTATDLEVKVGGKARPVVTLQTPAQTATAFQSWVLVFEPIRDTTNRAIAFSAAADFLTKVPDGDRVFIVARGKDTLESLMPGFSLRRGAWAEALAKVPGMLPEGLVGRPDPALQGAGFSATFTDLPDGPSGQEALSRLHGTWTKGDAAWAKGTNEQKGVKVLDRLNFNDSMFISGLMKSVGRDMQTLETLLGLIASIPGQKHLVVFSRNEADDLTHPSVKKAMFGSFQRSTGDNGGPAEAATLANRDLTILQREVKRAALQAGVTLYSVAGSALNILGNIGSIAPATGGFAFPLRPELATQFGQAIQVFGSRYLIQWEGGADASGQTLEISSRRKGVKVLAAGEN
jgi:hypothetical protein